VEAVGMNGKPASAIEVCNCPREYTGNSCEVNILVLLKFSNKN
jgi:hypothetical protein